MKVGDNFIGVGCPICREIKLVRYKQCICDDSHQLQEAECEVCGSTWEDRYDWVSSTLISKGERK